jgi:hypothetical protein
MAQASSVISTFRSQVEKTVEDLRSIDPLLAVVEDHGVDDAARQAFFAGEFGPDSNNQDITWTEFAQGIAALRAMREAWTANRYAIAKLIK